MRCHLFVCAWVFKTCHVFHILYVTSQLPLSHMHMITVCVCVFIQTCFFLEVHDSCGWVGEQQAKCTRWRQGIMVQKSPAIALTLGIQPSPARLLPCFSQDALLCSDWLIPHILHTLLRRCAHTATFLHTHIKQPDKFIQRHGWKWNHTF